MKRQQRRKIERLIPRLTMSEDLARMFRECDPETREGLQQVVLYYDEHMERTRNQDQAAAAKGMHRMIDGAQEKLRAHHPKASSVSCQKGCSYCCHFHVGVSLPEARLMLSEAKRQGVSVDLEKLRRQSGRGIQGWSALSRADRACAFLRSGECTIYESRPAACRKLQVISPPEHCDQVTNPGSPTAHLFSPEAEVVYSVLLTRQKFGSMPDMVLQAIEAA